MSRIGIIAPAQRLWKYKELFAENGMADFAIEKHSMGVCTIMVEDTEAKVMKVMEGIKEYFQDKAAVTKLNTDGKNRK